ncbi:NusB antitermination factor [Corynebacterium mustelae]|uniref:Transcription antitermination protein NusB n=1 Tax=Corynebacterium mustelae TaxID=571915 RepID=A0A0G3H4H0_9CORY|nr:NusB antitermination factor [Corynebacterium mustelae]
MADNNSSNSSRNQAKNWKRHGSRFKARRRAVDILYEAEARDVDPVAIVQDRVNLARIDESIVAPVAAYTREIIAGAAEELNRIDDVIAAYLSEDWELHRISAVDRAILRVAVWEMIFNEDVPLKTAMTEAIEMAAQYSGATAPGYINAVLDSALKNIDELRSPIPEPIDESEAESETVTGVDNKPPHDVEKLDDDFDDFSDVSFEEALAVAETTITDAEDRYGDESTTAAASLNEAEAVIGLPETCEESELEQSGEASGASELEKEVVTQTEVASNDDSLRSDQRVRALLPDTETAADE